MSDIPEWFEDEIEALRQTWLFRQSESLGAHLDATRSEMYANLNVFHSQVRTMLLFTLAPFATAIALLGADLGQSNFSLPQLLMLIGLVLLLALPFGLFAFMNLQERYRCYVASVVYAAKAHMAADIRGHPWLLWVERYLRKYHPPDNQALVERWMIEPPNTYLAYRRSLIALLVLASLGGVSLVLLSLFGLDAC